MVLFLAVAAEDDALAIRREERSAVVAAGGVRQLADVLAILVHDVQLQIIPTTAIGAEDDRLAVGRVAAFGVVARRISQAPQAAAVGIGLKNIQARIEVPLVAAPSAGLTFLFAPAIFFGILFLRLWIEMAAGEEDFLAIGRKIRARGLADAGADTAHMLALQIHNENLIKGIAAIFFLGLEDNAVAVGREIALAGADEIRSDLANIFQMDGLGFLPIDRLSGQQGQEQPNAHVYAPSRSGYLIVTEKSPTIIEETCKREVLARKREECIADVYAHLLPVVRTAARAAVD